MGMAEFFVELDFTFLEEILNYLENPTENAISRIIGHEAAIGVHIHASRFQNTDKNLHDFWEERLNRESEKGVRHIGQVIKCMEYIESNTADFRQSFKELEAFLPTDLRLGCKLYPIVGYDIGVVSEGNAFLNLGHQLFHEHERELLYFTMHELHHVGYTHYNAIYSLDELKTNRDLLRIIKYSTHLEGLAVYASFERRRRENGFTHRDYVVLNDLQKRMMASTDFFCIVKGLENEDERALTEEYFDVLTRMSDGDRLWYVAGTHMSQMIDLRLGREVLNQTIVNGPDDFFEAYNRATL